MVCYSKQLRSGLDLWNIIANDSVLDWIRDGVKIPFQGHQPDSYLISNKPSSKSNSDFIDHELADLLQSDVIEEVYSQPYCVSPIHAVLKKNGKFRLITDLRKLNESCSPPKFANEGIKEVLQLVKPNDCLVTFDIKNGFFHVPVHAEHRPFLGFEWKEHFYQWKCLPFGLNGSPYFFYKVIRPVLQYLRQRGLRIVAFVDDFLLMSSPESILSDRQIVLDTFAELGLLLNFEKSSLEPAHSKEYIGYVIKTVNDDGKVWIHVPQARIRKLRHDIRRALHLGTATARALARIAGQCVSMCKVILPSKLLLRNLYRLLQTRESWQDCLTIDVGTTKDLEWWLEALKHWNGRAVLAPTIDLQLTTDASSTGWGAHLQGETSMGFWNQRMSQEHSNYRELMAVMMALQSFKRRLQGHSVQLLSDNITTVAYLNHLGGSQANLSQLATAIWAECFRMDIQLHAKYLPGSLNQTADHLSRMTPKYEWMLHPALFRHIDSLFGPHDIDRFASMTTTQLPMYNSYMLDPLSSGVDALAQHDWGSMNNYVNPPFRLIPQVLDVIEDQGAVATLLAPYWPAQSWFQRLQRLAVAPPILLPVSRRTVRAVSHMVEPLRNRYWKICVWRISGRGRQETRDGPIGRHSS